MNYYQDDETFIEVDNFLCDNGFNEYSSNIMQEQDLQYYIYLGIDHFKSLNNELQVELDELYKNVEKSKLDIDKIDLYPIYDYECTVNRYIKYESKDYMNIPSVVEKNKLMIETKNTLNNLNSKLQSHLNVYKDKCIENKYKNEILNNKYQIYTSMIDCMSTIDDLNIIEI